MKGLFKKLAFAAPLVVCLPLYASAGDATASSDEPASKIFEDYSLTSATQDSGDSKVVNTNATMSAPVTACWKRKFCTEVVVVATRTSSSSGR